ncbi:MAG: ATP-binding cassette domain-containing protein [Notoacmeibacter sp.]|nr:ATP-binding cassette domain-containing protein [Notoacmeibacter sp.]
MTDTELAGAPEPVHGRLDHSATPLIVAENLTLRVPIIKPHERSFLTSPLQLFGSLYLSRQQRLTVSLLHGLSFSLASGERLGVIGPNGAGKSTLLRLLAGIYQPTSGRLSVRGMTRGLFDVSLGMNLEATGLENIYIRGLHMGMRLGEIRSLVPSVLDFAELGTHIDKPLMTYSTGMRLRLAIAVSTMIEPDILLLDEWIGTGDSYFNEKIKKRVMALIEGSRGLIIATHNAKLMSSLCTRGLVLENGAAAFHGPIDEALALYQNRQKQR